MSNRDQHREDTAILIIVGVFGIGCVYAFGWVLHEFWYHFPDFINFFL